MSVGTRPGEPVCQGCHLEAMGEAERQQFLQELGRPRSAYEQTCVYLCPRHQAEHDKLMERLGPMLRECRPNAEPIEFKPARFFP